jgi:hypothetical protein
MGKFLNRRAKDAERMGHWVKNARITAVGAATALNPLTGPMIRQANWLPPDPPYEMSQQVDLDLQRTWARYERFKRELANEATPRPPDEPVTASRVPDAGRTRADYETANQPKARRSRER